MNLVLDILVKFLNFKLDFELLKICLFLLRIYYRLDILI